jgi:hypothetical protein
MLQAYHWRYPLRETVEGRGMLLVAYYFVRENMGLLGFEPRTKGL